MNLKIVAVACIGLALALLVLGCQFDESTDVDADSIEVVDAGSDNEPDVAPWPVFALPPAPPNPTLVMEYSSGGSCGKTSNPSKWRVCATAPGTDPDVATACIDPAETIYGTHSTHSTGCCACTDIYGRCGSRGSCVAWGRVGQFVLTAGAESPFMDKCRCELVWTGIPPVASRSCGTDWDPNGHDPGPNGVCNDGDDSYIPQHSYPPDPPPP
jgi:hypothetical protein